MFKQFLIGLKQNLREEDNLSIRDKLPIPKVSSVRRFYCIAVLSITLKMQEKIYETATPKHTKMQAKKE